MSMRKRRKSNTADTEPQVTAENAADETATVTEPAAEEATGDDVAPETPDSAAEGAESATEEAVKAAEEDFEALYREASERLLRTKAEFDNYRKRMQREFGEIRQQTKSLTVEEFLLVYDHFQMALAHSEQTDDLDTLRQGIQMIQNEFERTFSTLGVEAIDATGQVFNPELHEAVGQEPSDDIPEGHVVRQWKAGFQSAGRLLRPASVIVSSGPAVVEDAAETKTAADG